jgi:hypothetical protein
MKITNNNGIVNQENIHDNNPIMTMIKSHSSSEDKKISSENIKSSPKPIS